MTLDPIEQRLARYSPPEPSPGLKHEVIEAVVGRIARRRQRLCWAMPGCR